MKLMTYSNKNRHSINTRLHELLELGNVRTSLLLYYELNYESQKTINPKSTMIN
jgi:hypothetical protein